MKISAYVVTMLVIGAIIVGFYGMVTDLSTEFGENINTSEYTDTYNKISDLQSNTNKTLQSIKDTAAAEDKSFFTGTWDAFTVTKDVVVGGVTTTVSSMDIGASLILAFTDDLNVGGGSNFITSFLFSILSVFIVGALIFLLIKRVW